MKSYVELSYWLSVVTLQTQVGLHFIMSNVLGKTIFGHVFKSFGPPIIEYFKYCRSSIQIDLTHLYGKYKEKLLITLPIDSNGYIFPLAFGLMRLKNHF